MNITKFYNLIKISNIAGIKQLVLKKEEDHVSVFGIDDAEEGTSVVIITKVDKSVTDLTMGINRIPVLLSRLNLFDLEQSRVELDKKEDYARSISIKEKRKCVTYSFSSPNSMNVPTDVINSPIVSTITFSKAQVENIIKGNQAIKSEHFTLKTEGNSDVVMELFDGISDYLTDVVGNHSSSDWSYNWKTDSVLRLMRQVIKSEESIDLGISEVGIMYIKVDGIDFMIMPQLI